MANPDQVRRLLKGVEVWNRWRKVEPNEPIDLYDLDLNPEEIEGTDLSEASLAVVKTSLPGSTSIDLAGNGAFLVGAELRSANLVRSKLCRAQLSKARMDGAKLLYSDMTDANLVSASLRGADLESAILERTTLDEADLRDADLMTASLRGASLRETRLDNARIGGVDLSGADIQGVRYTSEHRALDDGSEQLSIRRRDRWLNWSRLRQIGALPLFGLSYGALVVSLVVVSWVGYVNDALPEWAGWLINMARDTGIAGEDTTYSKPPHVPIPSRMGLALVSSFLLALGTTVYKLGCPARVQEFSETQWVEQHGRARLLYLAESWRRRWLQWPTAILTGLGGLLAVGVILERMGRALAYVWKYGLPW